MSGLTNVKNVLVVLSGKGGVGKSTVSVQLALALQARRLKVGLLDIDLCGPSVPRMMHMEGMSVHQSSRGWVPVFADESQTLGVMSIGFLTKSRDDPVIWRGPKKTAMIRQFLQDVWWGELDWLVIDTPPGTSDEHITIMENLRGLENCSAVLVTTSQIVAVNDVRREITFCRKLNVPIKGLIENMSGFVCPHCLECSNVFSKGGGKSLAELSNIPFLGEIPIDPQLTVCSEKGDSYLKSNPDSPLTRSLMNIVEQIVSGIPVSS